MNPLPPTEVRRQGDRLRRRNTILAGVGAALAVTLIAAPIAALSDRDEGPEPAPDPKGVDWVQTIPADFPLDDMMGGEGSTISPRVSDEDPSGEIVISTAEICGTQVWSAEDAADLLGAVWSNGVEGGEQRTLAVYADGPKAEAVVGSIEEELGGGCSLGSQSMSTDVTPLFSEGTLGWVEAFVRQGQPAGARVWQLTLVGNALLLDHTFVAEAAAADQAASDLADRASSVVDAMCVFSAEGCETPPPAEPASVEIPDGFPLLSGWPRDEEAEPGPEFGRKGPSRSIEEFSYTACGQQAPAPAAIDFMRAGWANVEDFRSRQLLTFADADEAVAYMADSREFFEGCPQDEIDSQGFQSFWRVIGTEVGGESYAVVQTSEFDGAPAVGMQVLQFIRVGHSVLIDTTANEGGAGPDPTADIARQINRQTSDAAEVVAAMCLFTEAGCG